MYCLGVRLKGDLSASHAIAIAPLKTSCCYSNVNYGQMENAEVRKRNCGSGIAETENRRVEFVAVLAENAAKD